MRPIVDVVAMLGIPPEDLVVFGEHMAKLRLGAMPPSGGAASGRVILVSAINPTRSGKGKTTVSIGLAQGLQRAGRRVALALREPSLGPIFGIKGGGTGGAVSPFAFLQAEWPAVYEAARQAAGAVHADPRIACLYARPALDPPAGRNPVEA
jgi:formyltetrahydrofolate synthetase